MSKDKFRVVDRDRIVPALVFFGFVLLIVLSIVGSIQAWVLYRDKPITEIPMWAWWFLRGN